MKVLVLRTDKPEAEVGVFDGQKQLAYETWQADRQLAETLHRRIAKILDMSSISLDYLEGIVVYEGPGSFTGLRIGHAAANALAYALDIPIASAGGQSWAKDGIEKLSSGQNEKVALPKYGAEPHITKPKK